MKAEASMRLRLLRERLSDPKYEQVEIEIRIGDPGYRITKFANEIGADLIVMPSHGRAGLAHMLLGSVAERVLRLSHWPRAGFARLGDST